MSLVSIEDRGRVRVITYANAPFGTMTAAGSTEMFSAIAGAGEDLSVRVIVITGGVPGIFIRHYESSLMPRTPFKAHHDGRRHHQVLNHEVSTRSRT